MTECFWDVNFVVEQLLLVGLIKMFKSMLFELKFPTNADRYTPKKYF